MDMKVGLGKRKGTKKCLAKLETVAAEREKNSRIPVNDKLNDSTC